MKNRILGILMALTIVCFSGCSFLHKEKEPEKTNAELVLQYIQEKNTDAIYDMLCEKLQKTPNIKEHIKETFDFIDGEIISYEINNSSGNAKWEDEKTKIILYSCCNQIKTSSDKEYQLIISYYDENDFEPELVGVYRIAMVEKKEEGNGFSKELDIECHW